MNKEKAQITLELAHLEGRVSNDDILKARTTKYYKREGSPGSYKYYYTKGDYEKEKGVGKEERSKKDKIKEYIKKLYTEEYGLPEPKITEVKGGIYIHTGISVDGRKNQAKIFIDDDSLEHQDFVRQHIENTDDNIIRIIEKN